LQAGTAITSKSKIEFISGMLTVFVSCSKYLKSTGYSLKAIVAGGTIHIN
jgi:hypothetical protein